MAVLVAGHICLDLIPTFDKLSGRLDALSPNQTVTIGPMVMATGGAVANTGLALYRLGVPARLMGKVGGDLFGQAILDVIRSHDPAMTDAMIIAPDEQSSYTLVISPPDTDRSFMHYPGTNNTFRVGDISNMELARSQIFHFGYPPLLPHTYLDGGRELASLFWRAKGQGVTTSLDMAAADPAAASWHVNWRALLQEVLPYVDIFLPSLAEIFWMLEPEQYQKMVDIMGDLGYLGWVDGALLAELATDLLDFGAAVVGLKLGERGLYIRTTENMTRFSNMGYHNPPASWLGRELLAPAFQAKAVGTVGAGDCAIAGFLTGLLQGWPLKQTTLFAAGVGAHNVEQADSISGIPRWDVVQQRIESGWAQREVDMVLPNWNWDEESRLWIGPNDSEG